MSIMKSPVEFTSEVGAVSVARSSTGNLVTTISVGGVSKEYGPFVGTFTVTGANKAGQWTYEGFAMTADNSDLSGSFQGTYSALGATRWRTIGAVQIRSDSALQSIRVEAEIDMDKRTWNGRLTPV